MYEVYVSTKATRVGLFARFDLRNDSYSEELVAVLLASRRETQRSIFVTLASFTCWCHALQVIMAIDC